MILKFGLSFWRVTSTERKKSRFSILKRRKNVLLNYAGSRSWRTDMSTDTVQVCWTVHLDSIDNKDLTFKVNGLNPRRRTQICSSRTPQGQGSSDPQCLWSYRERIRTVTGLPHRSGMNMRERGQQHWRNQGHNLMWNWSYLAVTRFRKSSISYRMGR